MRRAAIFRILGGAVIVLALLSGAGWLAFVPSAREPAYVFVDAWGGKGSGPGQFDDPTGIAVAHGEVLVSDARNGRIQVFDLEGNFKRQIGAPGQGPGGLGRPMNLSVADGEVYVCRLLERPYPGLCPRRQAAADDRWAGKRTRTVQCAGRRRRGGGRRCVRCRFPQPARPAPARRRHFRPAMGDHRPGGQRRR